MIVQENRGGVPWVDETAIGSGNWLKYDIIANIVLKEAVLRHRFFRFFSSHEWLSF